MVIGRFFIVYGEKQKGKEKWMERSRKKRCGKVRKGEEERAERRTSGQKELCGKVRRKNVRKDVVR